MWWAMVLKIVCAAFGAVFVALGTAQMMVSYRRVRADIYGGLRDNFLKPKAIRRVLSALSCALCAVLCAAILLFTANSALFRLTGKYVYMCPLVVKSGSMSYIHPSLTLPEGATEGFNAFDLVFIEHADGENLKVGDIIAFWCGEEIVIHRIAEIVERDGARYFATRGDANALADEGYVSEGGIVGAYYGAKVPYLGGGWLFLASAEGLCLLCAALYFCVMSSVLNSRLKRAEARRREVLRAAAEERASGAAEDKPEII